MKLRYLILVPFIVLPVIGWAAESYIPNSISMHLDVAQMGMGGLGTVLNPDAHALFYNPALLARNRFSLEFAPAGLGFTQDAIDVVNFVNKHQQEFSNFDSLTNQQKEQFLYESRSIDNKWVNLYITPFVGLSAKGIGLGAYSVGQANVKIDQGVLVPALGMRGYVDAIIGGGYGRKFVIAGSNYDLGLTVRYIQRRIISNMRIGAQDINNAEKIVNTALDKFKDKKEGYGIDFGAIRTFSTKMMGKPCKIEIGAVAQNLLGELDGRTPINLRLGVLARMPFVFKRLLPEWNLGMEMVDFFNTEGVNFFQRINIGTELSAFYKILKLRGGLHQGYPTAGIGLNFYAVHLDYAYFVRELGRKPGQLGETTHRLQITLGVK